MRAKINLVGFLFFVFSCSESELNGEKMGYAGNETAKAEFLNYKYVGEPDDLLDEGVVNECDFKVNSDGVYLLRAKKVNETVEPTCDGLYSWFVTKQSFELVEKVWGDEINRDVEIVYFSPGPLFREGWEGIVSLSYVRGEYFIAGYIEVGRHDSIIDNEIEGRNIIIDLPRTTEEFRNAIERVNLRSERCYHVQRNIESDEELEESFFSPGQDPNLRCGDE